MSILNSIVNGRSHPHLNRSFRSRLSNTSQTSSSASQPRPPTSAHTANSPPSAHVRSRPLSASSCPGSSPGTPCQKAPRPSPSTHVPGSRRVLFPTFPLHLLHILARSPAGFRHLHFTWVERLGSYGCSAVRMRYGMRTLSEFDVHVVTVLGLWREDGPLHPAVYNSH